LALDANSTLYVADSFNHRIRKVTLGGVVTTLAGNGACGARGCHDWGAFADGPGTSASFNFPIGVAVGAAGHVFVADSFNNRIRKVTPLGVVTTLAGSGSIAAYTGILDGNGRDV
jgi:hypothetical protein